MPQVCLRNILLQKSQKGFSDETLLAFDTAHNVVKPTNQLLSERQRTL